MSVGDAKRAPLHPDPDPAMGDTSAVDPAAPKPEDDAMPMAVLSGEGEEVTLHAWTAHPLNATELIIKGFGYESSEEARSRGERIQRALRATGAELHLPMDFGPDRARNFFFTRGLELLRERGVLGDEQVESDVHGLHVFEHGEQRVVFGPGDAHPTLSRPVGQRPRPEIAARHVEALISSTRTLKRDTDSDGRQALDSLLGALEGLRVQSIASAVGDLVRTHAPGPVASTV